MKGTDGNVRVSCPYCGHTFRTPVIFPAWNKPFIDTYAKCPICEELFPLHDPHEYAEDGTILNAEEVAPCNLVENA